MSRRLNKNQSQMCYGAGSSHWAQRRDSLTILKTVFMHALWVGVVLQMTGVTVHADTQDKLPTYLDTSIDFHTRAKDLVSRMTLEEKIPQLINDAPAIPRLGVPEYNWWNEGLHGVAAAGYATVFPQAIGMASTWDTPLMRQIAGVVSTEFRAKYYANQHRFGGSDWFGGLTVWSPNINIFRDPRWGRGQETYGEDPYLSSRLGVAYVQGLQGDDPHYLKTVATPKHFAVYSGPEAKRHHIDVHPSAKDLEETYFPAFRATVMEANAQSIMCSYNAVNGVPACANRQLLTDKLRKQWGFNGYVVSDCEAVSDVYLPTNHGYATSAEAGIKATFDAGMDLICGNAKEADHIRAALKQGLISESQIDQSLVRLFSARMHLGQFDPRPAVFANITAQDNDTNVHRQLALTVAEKSLVLLKNSHDILPLSTSAVKNVAVVGPNADNLEALVGNYHGTPSQPITVLQGIRTRFSKANIHYAPGSGLLDPIQSAVPDSQLCVDVQCHKPGLVAEYFADHDVTARPLRKRVEANARLSWRHHVASGAVRWTGYIKVRESGVYSLRYLANGGYRIWVNHQPIVDAWHVDWRPVLASGAVTLVAGKTYPLKVEAFQRGEQGDEKLVWSLPSEPGVKAALLAAQKADVVIFVGGLTSQLEGEEMPIPLPGFSGGDRTDLSLPLVQRQLLDQLYATGKPVVVVLMNGSAMAVNQADKKAAAIVEAWYPGQRGGQAVARLFAGDFSPAGRLPVTFYRSVNELPAFDNYAMVNRSYRFFNGDVLYPFGYGLSYSQFRYSHMMVSPTQERANQAVTVSVDVTNTGKVDADEVVQLYLSRHDVASSPIRTLVGFKRIHLAKGQTSTVRMHLDSRALSSVDDKGRRAVIPGLVTLWMGGGQPDIRPGLLVPAGQSGSFKIEHGQLL